MSLTYKRDDARRRISLTLTEPLTEDELIRAIDRQLTEGTWSYGLVYDTRQLVTSARVAISPPAAAYVADIATRVGPRGPVAILVSGGDMAAMSEAHASRSQRSGRGVKVYWSPAEALQWLEAQRSSGTTMPQARVEQDGEDYLIRRDSSGELGGIRVSQARLAVTLAQLRELGFEVVHV